MLVTGCGEPGCCSMALKLVARGAVCCGTVSCGATPAASGEVVGRAGSLPTDPGNGAIRIGPDGTATPGSALRAAGAAAWRTGTAGLARGTGGAGRVADAAGAVCDCWSIRGRVSSAGVAAATWVSCPASAAARVSAGVLPAGTGGTAAVTSPAPPPSNDWKPAGGIFALSEKVYAGVPV